MAASFAMVAGVLGGVFVMLRRRLQRPMEQLAAFLRRLNADQLDERLWLDRPPMRGQDEIDLVAEGVGALQARIASHVRGLAPGRRPGPRGDGQCLRDALRASSDWVARCGGEEFVLVPETPLAQAQDVAERLRQQIEQTVQIALPDGTLLRVTPALGWPSTAAVSVALIC